jgi:hypothetical protein
MSMSAGFIFSLIVAKLYGNEGLIVLPESGHY